MRRRRLLRGVAVGVGAGTITLTQEVTAQPNPPYIGWVFETSSNVSPSPTVDGGTVYIGDSNLYAVDATDGTEKWRFERSEDYDSTVVDGDLNSSPAVAGGTVYVKSENNNLYAVNATDGTEKWRSDIGDSAGTRRADYYVGSSPTVVGGTVYVGSDDTNLYAIDTQTGSEKWRFDTGGTYAESSPTVAGGTVYVGSNDGNLYAINAQTGSKKWRFNCSGIGVTGANVESSPTVAGGTVYVGSNDGNLYAVNARTGSEKWRFDTSTGGTYTYVESSPTVAGGTVYVGSNDGQYPNYDGYLYAINAQTGSEKWRFDTNGTYADIEFSPTVADGTVYFGSGSNLYAIDAQTGSEKWRFNTGDQGVGNNCLVVDGTVYIGIDGNLHAIYLGSDSNASSEGSRVLLGTLGHTDQFNPDAPAADATFTSTPTPTQTPKSTPQPTATATAAPTSTPNSISTTTQTPTAGSSGSNNGSAWTLRILLGLLGVGSGAYYWISDDTSQDTDQPTVSSGDIQAQNQSQEHSSLSADELWETYHSLSERSTEYPQHDPTAVEDRLNQAQRLLPGKTDDQTHTENSEDTETNLVEARDHLSEAQRLAGPTVEYFLSQGRQLVTDARASEEDGDIDAAVSLWQDAQNQYEQARERATEINDSHKSEIAETYTTVTERLAEAKRRQTESDIQQAITSAWNKLTTGDEYVADGIPKSGGKTAYKMAAEEYHTASNHLDGIHTDINVADADSIKTAITITQDAQDDCESIDILRRTQSELTKFVDSEKSTSLAKLTAILSDLNELPRKNESLYEQILTAVLCINLETARAELQQARAHFEQNEYQEASAALDDAETHMTTAADTVQKAPAGISVEPQSTVDTMQRQLDGYRAAVTEALTDINADPMVEPITEITLTPPSISELPSESDICQAVPARSTLWETITPELQPEYDALQSLLATVDASAFARWVSTEYDKRMTSHQTALDNIEPITASEKLPARREKILTDCRAIVSALTQRVTTDLTALEDANLPDDLYESPEEIPQVDTESRLEADEIEQFTQEWSESVNMLTEILHSFNTAVSVIEAYDEIADMIDKKLATSRTVSSEELPINFAEQALRLYAHRRSDVDFDPDQSLVYLIS